MNKSQLVDAIAAGADLSKAKAEVALNSCLSAITAALANGDSVTLVGFGVFSVTAKAARAGRNPKTGESMEISARNVPGFKAGKSLKDAVNQ
jgi:DNA-binding protein HU-beta